MGILVTFCRFFVTFDIADSDALFSFSLHADQLRKGGLKVHAVPGLAWISQGHLYGVGRVIGSDAHGIAPVLPSHDLPHAGAGEIAAMNASILSAFAASL